MKNLENLRIFKKLYDFSVWLFGHTKSFPKSHRFSIAVKLENLVLEVIELITTANMRKYKLDLLYKADEKLLVAKIFFRLSLKMRFINIKSYKYGAKELVETGKMLGMWIKQQKAAA